jgi:hypothetical protein
MTKPGPRWTREDIHKLKTLAQNYPAASIANELGRSVGALAVKAHQLKLSLRLRKKDGVAPSSTPDPGPAGFNWEQPHRPARGSQGDGQ